MTLIAILLTLLFDHYGELYKELRALRWYDAWLARRQRASRRVGPRSVGAAGLLLPLGLPVALALLVQWLLGGMLFGLVGLVLGVAVLYLCLGPLAPLRELDAYLAAQRAGDREAQDDCARRLLGAQPPVAAGERDRLVLRRLFAIAGEQIAAPVFCFVLLGPAGALGWRLALQLATAPAGSGGDSRAAAAADLLGILGWLPARLLGLAFALTGSFERTLAELRRSGRGDDLRAGNGQLLWRSGLAALDIDLRAAAPAVDSGTLQSARRLLRRSLWVCLGLVGLLTLLGWVA